MRRSLALIALGLPLAGCVVEPTQPYGYSPAAGYPASAYPQTEEVYPGYVYNDGSPYITVEGAAVPLIFFGGAWGYHDHHHRFHRAPDKVWRHLEEHNPRGSGIRPYQGVRDPRYFGGGGPRQAPPRHLGADIGRGPHQAAPRQQVPPQMAAPPPRQQVPPQMAAPPPRQQVPPQMAAPPPRHQAPPQVAAPPVRAPAPVQPQHQEHRGDHRCPPGQQRC